MRRIAAPRAGGIALLALMVALPAAAPPGQAQEQRRTTCTVDVTYFPQGAPPGFAREVSDVLLETAAITGIRFRQVTGTGPTPAGTVQRLQPGTTHIAVSWDEPERHRDVKFNGKLGVALMTYAPDSINAVSVVLNAEKLRPGSYQMGGKTYAAGPIIIPGDLVAGKPPVGSKNLLRHELGHALGLNHADGDATSIMTPYLTGMRGPGGFTADARAALRDRYRSCRAGS